MPRKKDIPQIDSPETNEFEWEEVSRLPHRSVEGSVTDPQVLIAEARARTADAKLKRTAWRIGARPAVALACFALGTVGLASCGSDLLDKFKSGVLHEDVQVSPYNALKRITLPNKPILVEGEGTGTAEVQTRPESDIPVLGGIFNSTVAKVMDKKTSAEREGVVQVGTKRNAITLRPFKLPLSEDGKQRYGIQANVDIKKLFSQVSMESARDKDGESKVNTDDDFFAFETVDGAAERGVNTADIADSGFKVACGKMLVKGLKAGVMVNVEDQINTARQLLEAMPGKREQTTAGLLKEMLQPDIKVNYVETYRNRKGIVNTRIVAGAAVQLPQETIYTSKGLAEKMGKSSDNVHVTQTGTCTPTGDALQQYYDILNKSNGIDTTKLGL